MRTDPAILAQDQRIEDACVLEPLRAKHAAVTASARTSAVRRIVTTVREPVVETELDAAADDVRFAEGDERRVHTESRAFDAVARRHGRQMLERGEELRPAVGIAGVVERVHADEEVVRAEDLGPAKRERQEDRVARGHIRRWNLL